LIGDKSFILKPSGQKLICKSGEKPNNYKLPLPTSSEQQMIFEVNNIICPSKDYFCGCKIKVEKTNSRKWQQIEHSQ